MKENSIYIKPKKKKERNPSSLWRWQRYIYIYIQYIYIPLIIHHPSSIALCDNKKKSQETTTDTNQDGTTFSLSSPD